MEFLKIRGGLIRLDGQVKAFTFGEKVSEHTAVVHVEKADPNVRGLFTAINKDFVQNAWQMCSLSTEKRIWVRKDFEKPRNPITPSSWSRNTIQSFVKGGGAWIFVSSMKRRCPKWRRSG